LGRAIRDSPISDPINPKVGNAIDVFSPNPAALIADYRIHAFPTAGAAGGAKTTDGKQRMFLFNIPAQPLQSALIIYAAVVETQLLYDTKTAQGRRGHAVVGLFTADTALRLLITETDLTILASDGDSTDQRRNSKPILPPTTSNLSPTRGPIRR
jgi:hypothetical protein